MRGERHPLRLRLPDAFVLRLDRSRTEGTAVDFDRYKRRVSPGEAGLDHLGKLEGSEAELEEDPSWDTAMAGSSLAAAEEGSSTLESDWQGKARKGKGRDHRCALEEGTCDRLRGSKLPKGQKRAEATASLNREDPAEVLHPQSSVREQAVPDRWMRWVGTGKAAETWVHLMKIEPGVDRGCLSLEGSRAGSLGNHPWQTPTSSVSGHQGDPTLDRLKVQHHCLMDREGNPTLIQS